LNQCLRTTGGDHPKTYEYLNYFNAECKRRGWPVVTVVKGVVKEKESNVELNLIDYCMSKSILPSMQFRWCTDKFKIRPVHKYCNSLMEKDEQAIMYIGIASDEAHRANPPKNPEAFMRNKMFEYPFVEAGITREQNICIIRSAGIEVPPKSGCYFCPFQKATEFKRLYKENPDLYQAARNLEKNVNVKRIRDFKEPLYLKNVAGLDYIVQEGQIEIDLSAFEVFENMKPCLCDV